VTIDVGELLAFLVLTAAVGTIGVTLGIFFLAPRLSRHAERDDEEHGAGHD
jgi:hypothetical protein